MDRRWHSFIKDKYVGDTDQLFYVYFKRSDGKDVIPYEVIDKAAYNLMPKDIEIHTMDHYEGQVFLVGAGEYHENQMWFRTFNVMDCEDEWIADLMIVGSANPAVRLSDPITQTSPDIEKLAGGSEEDSEDEFGGGDTIVIDHDF